MKHADFRRFVETECMSCVVDVAGFRWGDTPPIDGEILIGLVGRHNHRPTWKFRLKLAWKVLRGQSTDEIELMSERDTDDLISALQDCRKAIYGEPTKEVPQ